MLTACQRDKMHSNIHILCSKTQQLHGGHHWSCTQDTHANRQVDVACLHQSLEYSTQLKTTSQSSADSYAVQPVSKALNDNHTVTARKSTVVVQLWQASACMLCAGAAPVKANWYCAASQTVSPVSALSSCSSLLRWGRASLVCACKVL